MSQFCKICLNCMLILILSTLISCSGKSTNLAITPETFDFGIVKVNGTSDATFEVKNNSASRTTLVEIKLMGTDAAEFSIILGEAPPNIYLNSKEKHDVTVRFNPTTTGALEAQLYIRTMTWSKKIQLDGFGKEEPIIEVAPTSFDFGTISNNSTISQDFTVSNTGVLDLVLGAITLTGSDANQYAITAGAAGGTVTPGSNMTVSIDFTPTSDGAKSASIEIPHNADSTNPHIINLQGSGTSGTASIDVTPTTYDFGTVGVGASKVIDFDVENTGSADLFVTAVNLSGTNSADISCLTNLSLIVSAGTTEQLSIRFMPAAVGVRGPITVSLENNAGAPIDLTINGEGVEAYVITTGGFEPQDLSNSTNIFSTGSLHEDEAVEIPIGFTFNFYGNDYTSLFVSTNGFVTFTDASADSPTPTAIPSTTGPNNLIALFWNDMKVDMSGTNNDKAHYLLEGLAPDRTLTIEYFSCTTSTGGFVYGKLKLYETTNVFELLYTDPASWNANYFTGVTCAIGAENIDGTFGYETAAGVSPTITTAPTESYIFTPN